MADDAPGAILWRDLTVADAPGVAEFYHAVVGWEMSPHDMGDYHDFDVTQPGGDVVAGICHARGENAHIPPQWLLYVKVADVAASAEAARAAGGAIVDGPRPMGASTFCVIRDPAGAVLALID
jgi:predicted enzyme related to lactoylglutathione lyase